MAGHDYDIVAIGSGPAGQKVAALDATSKLRASSLPTSAADETRRRAA